MAIRGTPVAEITETDLQDLMVNRVRESQALEYKRDAYGRNDEQIREMLRDLSAMANAFGGDVLVGVDEDGDGIAIDLPGIENAEEEAQRMISSCVSNIEERIFGLVAWPVPLNNGRHVIVVRIPRSLRAPHMVTFRGLNQFWVRHDRQKSSMSIHEIREACLRVEERMDKLEWFFENRKNVIRAAMGNLPYYIVSVTPILVDAEVVDIRDAQIRNILADPPEQRREGWNVIIGGNPRPTLHGLSMEAHRWKSLELLRNGHLELRVAIDEESFCRSQVEIEGQQHPVLSAHPLVEYPVSLIRLGKAIYAYLGLTEPAVCFIGLFNVQGFALARYPTVERGRPASYYGPIPWREQDLEVGPRQIESLEQPDRAIRDFVDRIWQAFGFEQAPLFDAEGNFTP